MLTTKENLVLAELSKPVKKLRSLPVEISRYYTDVDGKMVDKALVPAALQVSYPVFMFCEFDRQGGYYIGLRNLPLSPGVKLLGSFVFGVGNPFFFGFSGLADIQSKIVTGDFVTVFTDDLSAPNYFIWIVQHVSKASISSVMFNSATGDQYPIIDITRIDYYTDNQSYQWQQQLQVIKIKDRIGNFATDKISPLVYRTPRTVQDGFVPVQVKTSIDQYTGFYTYMLFNTNTMQFNFNIKS